VTSTLQGRRPSSWYFQGKSCLRNTEWPFKKYKLYFAKSAWWLCRFHFTSKSSRTWVNYVKGFSKISKKFSQKISQSFKVGKILCSFLDIKSWWLCGWSPGLVVMGWDSCPDGCGFKSLDEHFWHKFVMFVWMTKINEKGAGDGPFLKVTVFHSTLGNNFMRFSDWHFIPKCTETFFPNQMAITCLGNIRYLHRDCVSSPMMRVYLVSDLVYLWIKEYKSSPLIWNHLFTEITNKGNMFMYQIIMESYHWGGGVINTTA